MKYYSTLRPISIGVIDNDVMQIVTGIKNFDTRQFVPAINRDAWGYIETEKELSPIEIERNELTAENAGKTEKEKRIAAAYMLVAAGYTKKEAYETAMEISLDEIESIIE